MLMPREDPVGKIVFAAFVLIVGLVSFVALMTLLAAVFRDMTERCKDAIQQTPIRVLLIGLAGYALFGGLAGWLYSMAVVERLLETEIVPGLLVAAVLAAVVPLILSILAAPGTFSNIGDRLAAVHGGEMSGLRRTALGTLVSVLAVWFPIIGWFVIAPVLFVMSFGAFVGSYWRRSGI